MFLQDNPPSPEMKDASKPAFWRQIYCTLSGWGRISPSFSL